MVPILGAGFAFTPIWYLRSTAAVYKKHLNEELETAISVITTSYLRSGDLLTAVKENLPYLNPPVKGHFESFIIESEMINANMISTLNNLKMKIPNQIFHEWCNTLIQCQSDRTMRNTLTYTVQKFSDQRILQSELEAIINEPKKEAFAMMFLVVGNIPLLYVLNHSWFETLMYSIPGKSPWQSVLPSYCFLYQNHGTVKTCGIQVRKKVTYDNTTYNVCLWPARTWTISSILCHCGCAYAKDIQDDVTCQKQTGIGKENLFDVYLTNIAERFSPLLKLDPIKRGKLALTLSIAGIYLSPETYTLKALFTSLIVAALSLPLFYPHHFLDS